MAANFQRAYRLIHDLYVLLDAGDRQVLQPFDLTPSQFTLLTLLDTNNGQRLTTLSDRLLVARSTITRLIDQLETAGLVQRVVDPADRRAQQVVLSSAGAALVNRAGAVHQASLAERFAALMPADQAALVDLLLSLRAGLRAQLQLPDEDE